MAKWRAIHKDITSSGQVDQLTEFEQLLFTWMIPHADDWGVITAEPRDLKLKVMPGSSRQWQEMTDGLRHMHELGLIWWYQPEGHGPLAQFREWDKHQPIRKERRKEPEYPLYDEKYPCPSMSAKRGKRQAKTGKTRLDKTRPDKNSVAKPSRKRDTRLDHAAIKGYKELARLHVPIALRDDWIECAEGVGVDLMLRVVKEWIGRGYRPDNVVDMMRVAREGWRDATHKQGKDPDPFGHNAAAAEREARRDT